MPEQIDPKKKAELKQKINKLVTVFQSLFVHLLFFASKI